MLFDKDKSGYIEAKEIREVTTTMGMPLSFEELEDFMKMADQNGDGKLDYNEFVKAMTKYWHLTHQNKLKRNGLYFYIRSKKERLWEKYY